MKPRPDAPNPFWPFAATPARDPSAARADGQRMSQTPAQARADRITSLVREITDAATKSRDAKVAGLRQARLARDAAAKGEAPPEAPKKKARKAKG